MMETPLFDLEARVAAIYPIHMLGDPENPPDWVEALGDELTDANNPIFDDLPELKPLADDDETIPERWAMALCLAGRLGFLVYYEACIRKYHDAGSWSSSWGYYRSGYVYAATVDEIEPKVIAIAERQHALEKAGV